MHARAHAHCIHLRGTIRPVCDGGASPIQMCTSVEATWQTGTRFWGLGCHPPTFLHRTLWLVSPSCCEGQSMRSSSGPLTSTTLTRMVTSPKRYAASGELRVACLPAPLLHTPSLFPPLSHCPRFPFPLPVQRQSAQPALGGDSGQELFCQALGLDTWVCGAWSLCAPHHTSPSPSTRSPIAVSYDEVMWETRVEKLEAGVGELALVPSNRGRAVWSRKVGCQRAPSPVLFGPNTLVCVRNCSYTKKKKYSVYQSVWLEHSLYME